jgi:hypothetical protein
MRTQLGVKTYYQFWGVNKFSGKRRLLLDYCPNVLLNSGKDILGNTDYWIQYCHVGTSNSLVLPTQTELISWASASNAGFISDTYGAQTEAPYYGWRRVTYRIEGVGNLNLNEVGIGPVATNQNLVTRTLLRNPDGNVVTITPLPDEFLEVQAEIRYYPPLSDVTGVLNIGGVNYNYILRAGQVTSPYWWGEMIGRQITARNTSASDWNVFDGDIGGILDLPSGIQYSVNNDGSLFTDNYVNNSFEVIGGMAVGPNGWNVTTGKLLRSFKIGTRAGLYQLQVDSQANPGFGIPKTQGESLTLRFRLGWAEKV